jgi:hypothetical protein
MNAEDFELEPDNSAPADPHDPPPVGGKSDPIADGGTSRLVPKLAVGVGGVAIAAGVFWLFYNEHPDSHGPQQPTYHNTSTYGYGSLAAGFATAGVGLYFWLRPDASSAATVTPLHGGGASAGWVWRF